MADRQHPPIAREMDAWSSLRARSPTHVRCCSLPPAKSPFAHAPDQPTLEVFACSSVRASFRPSLPPYLLFDCLRPKRKRGGGRNLARACQSKVNFCPSHAQGEARSREASAGLAQLVTAVTTGPARASEGCQRPGLSTCLLCPWASAVLRWVLPFRNCLLGPSLSPATTP